MSKPSTLHPTAADVRAFFRSNEKRLAALSPEARHTVEGSDGKAPRGRLHAEVIKSYNKGRKPERQYVLGVGKSVTEQRKADREALRKAGIEVGKVGPLSNAAKDFLSQSK